MAERRRTGRRVAGAREAIAITANLGGVVRLERVRRRWKQSKLANLVGLEQSRLSEIERGLGAGAPLEVWIALGIALGRPLAVGFSGPVDPATRLADAGHLELQEAILAVVRRHAWQGTFELPTRSSDPSRSVDVFVRDDASRRLLVLECWNRFGDLGAGARSSSRKAADASQVAVAAGGDSPFSVHLCWLVRPSAANRELIRRYPGILRSRFRGSSSRWVRALNEGTTPPNADGLVWFDPATRRAVAMRLRAER